jgi:hypothetical protein
VCLYLLTYSLNSGVFGGGRMLESGFMLEVGG